MTSNQMHKFMFLTLLIASLAFLSSGCEYAELADESEKDNIGQENVGDSTQDGGAQDEYTDVPDGFEEEPDDSRADPVKTFNYSVLAKSGHPRLLADVQGFKDLKTKVTSGRFQNPTLYKLHSEVLARAEKIVKADRTFEVATDHYIIVDNLLACAYTYKMKGQQIYLEKVRRDMEKVCALPNWDPWGLAIGEISMAMGLVYDWLYYDLSLDDRTMVRKALVEKAIVPMYKNNNNISIVGNWNQINLGGVSVAAMAVYEKNKLNAYNLMEKAASGNKNGVTGIYTPDGNYAEGLGYWEYGGGYQACYLSCLKGIFGHTGGIAEVPGFMNSGEYAMFMHGTMNTTFTYNDGGATSDPFLLTSWWFAAQNDDPTLIYCEKRRLNDPNDKAYKNTTIDGTEQPYRLLAPMVVMIRDFDMERPVNPPVRQVWSGRGEKPVVMVRHGWKFDETDVFLGVLGGLANSWDRCRTAHGHMDAGSFVFESEGVRWSDDIMRPNYGPWYEALRVESPRKYTVQDGVMWDTFRVSNLCHSTIVSSTNDGSVPGKLHSTDFYVDGFASLEEVIDSDGRQGGVINMTEPMKGQVKSAVRTVELVNGTDLVVTDEITALDDLDCELEWRMLSISSSSVSSDGITLTKGSKTRTLSVTSSSAAAVPEYKSWKTALPSTDNWGKYLNNFHQTISDRTIVGWSVTVPKGEKVTFVTTLKK